MLTVGSLFTGIGGLDLGLERAGMQIRWQCEIDPYCRAVLAHHWPGLHIYEDIRDIDGSAEPVDLICGGFPCQPVSLAGKGLAQEDSRWLWPEFARVVGDLRPRYVLVENVPGLVKRGLDIVVTGLAEMGYDAEWEIVSAAACGAPHLRERIFVIAHAQRGQLRVEPGWGGGTDREDPAFARVDGSSRNVAHTHGKGELQQSWFDQSFWRRPGNGREKAAQASSRWWWAVEPDVGRVAHGVPNRLAQLRALGNAVVPQVAEAVGQMILEAA